MNNQTMMYMLIAVVIVVGVGLALYFTVFNKNVNNINNIFSKSSSNNSNNGNAVSDPKKLLVLGSKTNPGGTSLSGSSSTGLAVSNDNSLIVVSNSTGTYYSYYYNSSWGAFAQVASTAKTSNDCRLTGDKTKLFLVQGSSLNYYTISISSGTLSFSAKTTVPNSTAPSGNYTGIGISSDGKRVVLSTNSPDIFFTNLNSSTYNSLAKYTLSTNNKNIVAINLSPDGTKIYYNDNDNNLFFGDWDGEKASNVTLLTNSFPQGKISVSEDKTLFVLSDNKCYYSIWDGTSSYSKFIEISKSSIPGTGYYASSGLDVSKDALYLIPNDSTTVFKSAIS